MSQDFPGVDAPASGGASAPGIYLFPFPAGGGVFPIIPEMTGGDTRFAKDYAPSIEGLTNRTNWLFHRTPDFFSGGDYVSGFRALLQFGNTWYLDRSWNNGTEAVVQIYGPTGGGDTLEVFAGGGNGNAIKAQAFGNGLSLNGMGTVQGVAKTGTNTPGGNFTGDGTAAGAECTGGSSGAGAGFSSGGGGAPAAIARNGPIRFGQGIASSTTAPGVGCCWPQSFDMASGNISSDGAGGYTVNRGLNIASVARASIPNPPSADIPVLRATFTQAMSSVNYVTTVNLLGNSQLVQIWDQTTAYVDFVITDGSGNAVDPATNARTYMFRCSLN